MLHTYKAILRGNRLEWSDAPPASLTLEHPVAVHVTILEETKRKADNTAPGRQMAAILEQLAKIETFAEITDPAAWEREIRRDRDLPGRES